MSMIQSNITKHINKQKNVTHAEEKSHSIKNNKNLHWCQNEQTRPFIKFLNCTSYVQKLN